MAVSWEFIKIPLQMELFPFHSDKIWYTDLCDKKKEE